MCVQVQPASSRAPARASLLLRGGLGDLGACAFQLFKRTTCQFYKVIYYLNISVSNSLLLKNV